MHALNIIATSAASPLMEEPEELQGYMHTQYRVSHCGSSHCGGNFFIHPIKVENLGYCILGSCKCMHITILLLFRFKVLVATNCIIL